MILSICDEPNLMNVIRIVILMINIIKVLVPIILIISVSIKLVGAVTKHDQDEVMKTVKSCIPNILAAVIIFLIPTFVDIVAKISFPNSDYSKCISGISKESVGNAYYNKMESLVSKAEEELTQTSYTNAKSYLPNIKDNDRRKEYEERLNTIYESINKKEEEQKYSNSYAKVNYSNFKWTPYKNDSGPATEYFSNMLPYAVWAPEDVSDLNGVSLPLIVWLHGAGELSYQPGMSISNFTKVGFPKVVGEWSKSGLQPIPAIIVAPQAGGRWIIDDTKKLKYLKSIKALIEYAKAKYNIDMNNVVLMGHSMGGDGVIQISYAMQKEYSHDYFGKMVTMSATYNLKYPPKDLESGKAYFSSKEIKGYSENDNCKPFFDWISKPENFRSMKGTSHGDVPRAVMYLDEDKDGVSDLVYWLFGKNEG